MTPNSVDGATVTKAPLLIRQSSLKRSGQFYNCYKLNYFSKSKYMSYKYPKSVLGFQTLLLELLLIFYLKYMSYYLYSVTTSEKTPIIELQNLFPEVIDFLLTALDKGMKRIFFFLLTSRR